MILSILLMGSPQGGGNSMLFVMPLVLVVMYFFMIRPQTKKAKEAQQFKDKIEKGQKIVTIGGIHGRVLEIKDGTFVIEVGNGLKLEIEKSAVSMESTKAVNNPKPVPAPKA